MRIRAELAALREESEAIRRRIAEIESRLPERPHRCLGVEDVIVLRLTNSEAEQLCRALSLNWPEHLNVEFRILAKVVDVSPEDDLVIFGRRTIRIDEVLYQQNISGTVERERLDQQRQIDASEVRDLSIDTTRLK